MSIKINTPEFNQPQIPTETSSSSPVAQKPTPQFETFEIKRPMFNFSFSRSLGSRFRSVIKKPIRALSKQNDNANDIQELKALVAYTKDHLAKVNNYLRRNKANAKAAGKKAAILEAILKKFEDGQNQKPINLTRKEFDLIKETEDTTITESNKIEIKAKTVKAKINELKKTATQFEQAKQIEKDFKQKISQLDKKNIDTKNLINQIKQLNNGIDEIYQTHEHTAQKIIWKLKEEKSSNPKEIEAYENLIKLMKSAQTPKEYEDVVKALHFLNKNPSDLNFNLIANTNTHQNLNHILELLTTNELKEDSPGTGNPKNDEQKKESIPSSTDKQTNEVKEDDIDFDDNTFKQSPLLEEINDFKKAIDTNTENKWLQKKNKSLNNDATKGTYGKFDQFNAAYILFSLEQTKKNFDTLVYIYQQTVKENLNDSKINKSEKEENKDTTPSIEEKTSEKQEISDTTQTILPPTEEQPKEVVEKKENKNDTLTIQNDNENLENSKDLPNPQNSITQPQPKEVVEKKEDENDKEKPSEKQEISDITPNSQNSITQPPTEEQPKEVVKKEENKNDTPSSTETIQNLNEEPEISDTTQTIQPPTKEQSKEVVKEEENKDTTPSIEGKTLKEQTSSTTTLNPQTQQPPKPDDTHKKVEDENDTPIKDALKQPSNNTAGTMQTLKEGIEKFGNQTKKTFQETEEFLKETTTALQNGLNKTTTALQNGLNKTTTALQNGLNKTLKTGTTFLKSIFSRNTTNDDDDGLK